MSGGPVPRSKSNEAGQGLDQYLLPVVEGGLAILPTSFWVCRTIGPHMCMHINADQPTAQQETPVVNLLIFLQVAPCGFRQQRGLLCQAALRMKPMVKVIFPHNCTQQWMGVFGWHFRQLGCRTIACYGVQPAIKQHGLKPRALGCDDCSPRFQPRPTVTSPVQT